MRRSTARTETISCDGAPPVFPQLAQETAFEKQRGISRVEIRHGFCQVHVSDLKHPLMQSRVETLQAIADSGISIDFLKLTPSGMSFVVPHDQDVTVQLALAGSHVHFSVRTGRSIVLVHAVNMRDEEGLIAEIVQSAISSGAQIDHIGDGHDRLLLVVSSEHAQRVSDHFDETLAQPGRREPRLMRRA